MQRRWRSCAGWRSHGRGRAVSLWLGVAWLRRRRSGRSSGSPGRAGASRSRRCRTAGIPEPGDPFYELDWAFLHEHPQILRRHWEMAWREGRV